MAKITTRIGSHEIEVEIPDDPTIESCCGCIHPIIEAELEDCEVPDPVTEVVQVPNPPVVVTTPPDPTLEVPISVISSLLPCDYPGIGPCPETIYHPIEEIDEVPEDVDPITIHFDYDGEEMASGDLYLITEVVSHCCCTAEDDDDGKVDRVHFYPKYKWTPRRWRVTDWRRMYGPVTVTTNQLCSCISKKTMIMNSVEVRLAGSKWETRNPIAQQIATFIDENVDETRLLGVGCPLTEDKEVLYRVYIDQCRIWKQKATLEYVCGRLYNFTLSQPENMGPNTLLDVDYVSYPKLVCESSASPDTECGCVAKLEFTHRRLHIDGLCYVISDIEKVDIQLPYIEYLGQPTLNDTKTGLVFPRIAVDWCQYASEIRRADDGTIVDSTYCHCNLPNYTLSLPQPKFVKATGVCDHGGCTASYNMVMDTNGSQSYVMYNGQPFTITQDTWDCPYIGDEGECLTPLSGKYSIIVDLAEEKDDCKCKVKIHGYRQYWTFCCGRLVKIESASTVDLVADICDCDCSCSESETPSSEIYSELSSSEDENSSSDEEPSSSDEEPSYSYEEPSSSDEEPSSSDEEPSYSYEEPSSSDEFTLPSEFGSDFDPDLTSEYYT